MGTPSSYNHKRGRSRCTMASNIANLGGYDPEIFEQPPPDDLTCLICTLVAKDPQQVTCCGKIFCRECLVEHNKRSRTCAQCRKTGTSFPDQRSERHIKSLKVTCDNHNNGCTWKGELNSLQEHCSKCQYRLIDCPKKCKEKVLQKNLQGHLDKGCPNRIIACNHCKQKGAAVEITTTHLEKCPQLQIVCINEGCNAKFPRCDLIDHRITCLYEKKICKYSNIGCTTLLLRKDLKCHEENDQLHLHMAVDTISELKAQVTTHASQLRLIQTELDSKAQQPKFTFKLPDFSDHKKRNIRFATPSFYSHPGGYKFTSKIYANGDTLSKNKSTSLHMFIMRGEYDNELPWPFTGSITIELLNQLEDDKHHTRALPYPEGKGNEANQRVTTERGIAEIGYGFSSFIAHTELGYKPELNRQYLKDDSLFFRITVHPPVQPKPWLVCTQ